MSEAGKSRVGNTDLLELGCSAWIRIVRMPIFVPVLFFPSNITLFACYLFACLLVCWLVGWFVLSIQFRPLSASMPVC